MGAARSREVTVAPLPSQTPARIDGGCGPRLVAASAGRGQADGGVRWTPTA